MKKTMTILIFVLLLGAVILALTWKKESPESQEITEVTETTEVTEAAEEPRETLPGLPDSVLYYGEIQKIKIDEEGTLSKLIMDSERSGPYIMNIFPETVFIDSGERTAFDPEILKEGDRIYVFHSPIAARSMPPQSAAFALVRNIPMDAGCAMYHEIEKLEEKDGLTLITTDNGGKVLAADKDTEILSYGEETSLQEGGFLMAWYWDRGEEILHASHLMLLP